MKKKVLTAASALLALLCCVTMGWAAGTQTDPLVSLGYLNGTYLSGLKNTVARLVEQATQPIYAAAAARAGQGSGASSGGVSGGWLVSSAFAPGEGVYSDTITLNTGSGLLWDSGTALVGSGTLVDATSGIELTAGGVLAAGHRYLAGTEATVVVSSQSARWMAEGEWKRGTGGTVEVPLPFIDVSMADPFYNAVKWNYEHNFVKGTTATTFRPANTITRGQIVLILYRHAGSPYVDAGTDSYTYTYSDMPYHDTEMCSAIIWATNAGIVEGYGNGLFGPGNPVRKQEMAKLLYVYNRYRGGSAAGAVDLASVFTDSGSIGGWAVPFVQWAAANGVMGGTDGKFDPQSTPMRWQVAEYIYNYGLRFGV